MNNRMLFLATASIISVQIASLFVLLHRSDAPVHVSVAAPLERTAAEQGAAVADLSETALLRAAVREVLRQELDAYLSASSLAAHPPQARATVAESDPKANAAAYAQSRQVIDQALARGKWSVDDNAVLVQFAGALSQTQRTELLEKFSDAISRKQIPVPSVMPPL